MSEQSSGPSLQEIQADTVISAERAVEIFRDRKADMTEGIRRNLYWPVRDFASGYMDNAMRKSITDASKMSYVAHDYTEQMKRVPNASQVRVFFGDRAGMTKLSEMRNLPHLRFQYTMDDAAREQIGDDGWRRVYRGVEQLQPGSVKFVANGAEYSLDAEGKLPEAMQDVTLKQSAIDRQFAWMTEPLEDYSQSRAVIMALAKEHNILEEEAERLAKAVDEFGNYHEREKDNRGVLELRGSCLVTPLNFNSFAEERHGLHLEIAHYGDGVHFYHEVSLLDQKLVIDWTHRQFDGTFYPKGAWEQYPYIFSEDQFKLPEKINPSISSSID